MMMFVTNSRVRETMARVMKEIQAANIDLANAKVRDNVLYSFSHSMFVSGGTGAC